MLKKTFRSMPLLDMSKLSTWTLVFVSNEDHPDRKRRPTVWPLLVSLWLVLSAHFCSKQLAPFTKNIIPNSAIWQSLGKGGSQLNQQTSNYPATTFESDLLPELGESMGSVLKTDTTMLKEIEKIPIWHFPYVLIKKEPVWKNC